MRFRAIAVSMAVVSQLQQSPRGSIEGLVVRAGTGEPVAGRAGSANRCANQMMVSDGRTGGPSSVYRPPSLRG